MRAKPAFFCFVVVIPRGGTPRMKLLCQVFFIDDNLPWLAGRLV